MSAEFGSIQKDEAGARLTASQVVLAYRLFFDRVPESNEVVVSHIERYPDLQSLRTAMLGSEEFRLKAKAPASKPLTWPPISVDIDVSAAQLAEMVRLVEGNWEELGRKEPHWSVLTHDQFKSDSIHANKEKLYQTGQASVDLMTIAASRCAIDLGSMRTCVELGCGVGRVTVWLAKHFDKVVAVDISRPHIALAEEAARQQGVSNVEFTHATSLQSLRGLQPYDVLYSVIVLQHNPPPVICSILESLLLKLNPGGIAYFQVPTYKLQYNFNSAAYLESAEVRGNMEVHVVPQRVLFEIFEKSNCRVLEIREDNWAGSAQFISNSFLIQKRQ